MAERRPTNADLDGVCGTFQDFWDRAAIRNSPRDSDRQVAIWGAAADVTVDIIVPRQLILIIARRIGRGRVHVVMIEGEEIETEPKLFHLRGAFDSLRACFRARESGQQQTRENGDDRDDHEQLDQSESPLEGR